MSKTFNRRDFLTNILGSASDFLGAFTQSATNNSNEPKKMAPEILADLTPELLALEAERLGLDPKKDRHRVLRSIQEAMESYPDR